jgi:hypothetical protein
MALTLTTVVPEFVAEDGGFLLRIAGNFDDYLGQEFEVFIGVNGDDTDAPAFSGVPGRPHIHYPFNGEEIRVYSPLLAVDTHSIFVRQKTGSDNDTLVDVLEAFPKDFKSSIYDHRKAWSPRIYTGPRSIVEEEPV